tara:strand:- start:695 stop:2077 length:1383 start_codon:yes stop_codon:yes gene_type:complete
MLSIDIIIVICFLFLFLSFGVYQNRFNQSSNDYFTAGGNIPWYIAMFSIVATETSVLTFVSVPGIAYRGNWFFLQLAFGYIIGRVLVSRILLPLYFSNNIVSIYELIGLKFNSTLQKISSLIFLVTRVLADGVRFLATAVIVQVISGWSIEFSVLIIGIITLVYSISGGLKAIMFIDSIQFIIYLLCGVIIIGSIISNYDISIISSLNESSKMSTFKFSTTDIFGDSWFFLSAIIGGIFLSFASHGADYMMVQRVLACDSLKTAQKAMIGSGFFVLLQFFIFLFVGSLIWYHYGGIEIEKDRELSTYIMNDMPLFLRGILLTGVLSAAMSTLSSSINALASSTIIDWMKGKQSSLKLSRLISLAWALVLIGIAIFFDESDTAIVILGLKIASYTYGGLLGMFLLTFINKKFSSIDVSLGLLISIAIVFYLQSIGLAWTWFILISLISFLGITVSSYLIRK